jgi:transposase InsO family protein
VSAAKRGTDPAAPPGSRSVAELEAEVAKLRKELAVERMEKDVLKGHRVLREGVAARYAFMKSVRLDYPLGLLCRVFGVSRSGFYAALERQPSQRAQDDERLKIAIKAAHVQTRETYAPCVCSRSWFRKGSMLDVIDRCGASWVCAASKTQVQSHDEFESHAPGGAEPAGADLTPARPNEAWVSDITYVPTDEGWLYLAGIKDVFTCEMVGYEMGARMTQGLTAQALWRAVRSKRPAPGLILHSDRGSQYCADDYRKLVAQFGMQASMSRKGNCYDNAPMESFWGSLKNEMIHHQKYATRANAEAAIKEYIEIFYNRQRRHSRLGYVSPASFAESFRKQALAA